MRTGVSAMKGVIEKGGARVSALLGTKVLHLALPALHSKSRLLSEHQGFFIHDFHMWPRVDGWEERATVGG